jgi:hypothetical protein
MTVRQTGSEIVRELAAGDLAVVPKGCWHRNEASDGVTMLFRTPSDGNQHSWWILIARDKVRSGIE